MQASTPQGPADLEVTINDVPVLRPDDNIWLSHSNLCVHGVRFFIATPIRAHFRARSGFNITIQDVADGRKPTGNELLPVWVVTGRLAPYRYTILKPLLRLSVDVVRQMNRYGLAVWHHTSRISDLACPILIAVLYTRAADFGLETTVAVNTRTK